MPLSIRPREYTLPSFSLTGDLIGFLRCGLQYRYSRIGNLPASNPVQMWFGEFIHGFLEEAFRRYHEGGTVPPWSRDEVDPIIEQITRRLAAKGLFPWSRDLEETSHRRAVAVVNELGPHLFPLIHRAEVRLTGTRVLPVRQIPVEFRLREADRYEIVGVVDVVTHVQFADPRLRDNPLLQMMSADLPNSPADHFEVILDYKGMRRPAPAPGSAADLREVYDWQVQTYARLRSRHPDSLPIAAGVIVYTNELCPTWGDLRKLQEEIAHGTADGLPAEGTAEATALANELRRIRRHPEGSLPDLPFGLRLRRAIRVVPVSDDTIRAAMESFDEVVARIETCRGIEQRDGRIVPSWEKNATDRSTCTACDARSFCPEYSEQTTPQLPAARV